MAAGDYKHLEDLLIAMKESLEREMRENAGRIERAVRRHSSIIGLKKTVHAHEQHFLQLERRIAELEKRNGSQK